RRGAGARRRAEASLHHGPVLGGAAEPSRRAAGGDHSHRRGAEPAAAAARLPLSPALPPGHAALRRAGAEAHACGRQPGGLPSVCVGRVLNYQMPSPYVPMQGRYALGSLTIRYFPSHGENVPTADEFGFCLELAAAVAITQLIGRERRQFYLVAREHRLSQCLKSTF